jgi:hypothetical protein
MKGEIYTTFVIEIEFYVYRARAVNEITEELYLLSTTDKKCNAPLKDFCHEDGTVKTELCKGEGGIKEWF